MINREGRLCFTSHVICFSLSILPTIVFAGFLAKMSWLTSNSVVSKNRGGEAKPVDSELRPGGMLVRKRDGGFGSTCPMIKIKVSHGTYQSEITMPAYSTFGELKRVIAQATGLEPHEQRLLFEGNEKENEDYLHTEGVKNMSKVVVLEDFISKERKDAVALVKAEVDKLVKKFFALESKVYGGKAVEDKEFTCLTELLMVQLLKLDSIQAEGEARVQRKNEVLRVLNYTNTLDMLKKMNSKNLEQKEQCYVGDDPMGVD